ncbi:MAG: phospholipid carrier-dependent glycosyltransferase [Candidatus Eremiobacteraeota bacterium]|nr:phospholipid carrier-dependent glycosyltransferase [Candidatus Eremiobacteraeota bacterium]
MGKKSKKQKENDPSGDKIEKNKIEKKEKSGSTRFGWIDVVILTVILLVSLWIRIYGLSYPTKVYFDETHYVPAARDILEPGKIDRNDIHPPMAKYVMAAFMKCMGDKPVGWRAGSVAFGLIMIIIMYLLGLAMFKSRFGAIMSASLLSIEFLHIAQSRIATLDIYIAAFILIGYYFAYLYIEQYLKEKPEEIEKKSGKKKAEKSSLIDIIKSFFITYKYAILSSLFLGLAFSVKLSALAGVGGVFLYVFIMMFLKTGEPSKKEIKFPPLYIFPGIPLLDIVIIALVGYFPAGKGIFALCWIYKLVAIGALIFIDYKKDEKVGWWRIILLSATFTGVYFGVKPLISQVLQLHMSNKIMLFQVLTISSSFILGCIVLGYAHAVLTFISSIPKKRAWEYLDGFFKLPWKRMGILSLIFIIVFTGTFVLSHLPLMMKDTSYFGPSDVSDWSKFLTTIKNNQGAGRQKIWTLLDRDNQEFVTSYKLKEKVEEARQNKILENFNKIVNHREFYSPEVSAGINLGGDAGEYLKKGYANISTVEKHKVNRRLIEALFPAEIKRSPDKVKWERMLYRRTFDFHYKQKFEHPYLSQMWEWPIVRRPIWYEYEKKGALIYGIVAIGSLLFWWSFIPVLFDMFFRSFKDRERNVIFILCGYLPLYLFWLSSFSFHGGLHFKGGFFYYMLPCVPFMALALTETLDDLRDSRLGKVSIVIYCIGLIAFLIFFFPILTGSPITQKYYDFIMKLNIFKRWI